MTITLKDAQGAEGMRVAGRLASEDLFGSAWSGADAGVGLRGHELRCGEGGL